MDLYKVLGIDRGANEREIKKAYFELAKKHHPDKGGEEEEFKKIQKAYDILSNPDKKMMYDHTGQVEDSGDVSMGHGFGMSGFGMPGGFEIPIDIGGLFGMFGGGGPGARSGPPSQRRRGKAPPKVHDVNLTLADFYKGRSLKIQFGRQKFCKTCKGDGYTSSQQCSTCSGSGTTTMRMMMGPGMQVMSQGPCGTCNGSGKKAGPSCPDCSGKCFTQEEKSLEVKIEPGMKASERLIFPSECSDHPEFAEAGDVHINLVEADEDIPWKRNSDNLCANLNLTLEESLLGCEKVLDGHPGFPDGYKVIVPSSSVNQQVLHFAEGGMPIRNLNRKGEAIITLQVKVTDSEKKAILKNTELLRSILKTGQ